MKRPSLIVHVTVDEHSVAYTCESLHINFDGTVTAFSSGKPLTVSAERVTLVEYSASGVEFCPWCDQSISNFVKV